jgi:hypothetical protein
VTYVIITWLPSFLSTFMPGQVVAIAAIAGVAIGKSIAEIVSDVSQIAPIPGLGVAAALVLTIAALCEGATLNK